MIYKLSPTFIHKIWGGKKLQSFKGRESINSKEPLGETWEVSTHQDGPSFVGEVTLESLIGKLNYLVKFIDTSDDLSIQVHPDNEYALKHEKQKGKTECWLILEAFDQAGIYLGLKSGVTKESLQNAVDKKLAVNELLNFVQVKAGDFFWVPAGTIHAISKNVTMVEVQQSSGVTYRFWDWNRVDAFGKSRELHLKESFEVLNTSTESNSIEMLRLKRGLFDNDKSIIQLAKHPDFQVEFFGNHQDVHYQMKADDSVSLINLFHPIVVNDVLIMPFESILVKEEKSLKIKSTFKSSFLIVK